MNHHRQVAKGTVTTLGNASCESEARLTDTHMMIELNLHSSEMSSGCHRGHCGWTAQIIPGSLPKHTLQDLKGRVLMG